MTGRILITGVSGQVGSYLAEMLLADGHAVLGVEASADRPLPPGVERARGSITSNGIHGTGGIDAIVQENGALTAIVHLASITSMVASWTDPLSTFDLNGRAGVALAFALTKTPGVRLVHASSAEIFGRTRAPSQDESTPIDPVSPYGIAKAAAHFAVRLVRQTNRVPASNLILYLAESPRRLPNFVLRKITRAAAAILCGDAEHIVLGNTDAVRDFCHARDVATAAKLLALGEVAGGDRASDDVSGDYVCASGQGRSIREVAESVCRLAGLDPRDRIRVDPALFRVNDIPSLVGDSRSLQRLGWRPHTSFDALVRELLDHDLAEHRAERAGRGRADG